MNERIKQLMGQTLDEKFAGTWSAMDLQDLTKFADRFAELIVAECLKIAKNREDEFESAGLLEESNAVGNVAYRISRQFGVKR
jgi:hypothetical protein